MRVATYSKNMTHEQRLAHNEYRREKYRNKTKQEKVAYNLVKYRLSLPEFNELLKKQKNRCAICRIRFDVTKHRHVDHNHKTKKIRGILCRSCNLMIGQSKDNPKTLRKAAIYLEETI